MKLKKILFLISIIILSILSIALIIQAISIASSNLLVTNDEKNKAVVTLLLFGICLLLLNAFNIALFFKDKLRSNKIIDIIMVVLTITYLVLFLINNFKSDNIITKILTIIFSIFILYESVFYIMEIGGYEK